MAIKPLDSHEHYRHRRRNEGGRLHDCRRVSAHFVRPSALVKATEGSPRSQVVTHSNQDNEQNNTDSGENEGQNVSCGEVSAGDGLDKEFTTSWEGKDPLIEEDHYARVTQWHSDFAPRGR